MLIMSSSFFFCVFLFGFLAYTQLKLFSIRKCYHPKFICILPNLKDSSFSLDALPGQAHVAGMSVCVVEMNMSVV